MDATDARQGADLLDEVDTHLAALACGIARAGHPGNHLIRYVEAWHMRAHPFRRLGGSQRANTHQDEYLAQQSQVLDLLQKDAQQPHVITVLGLDELGAGLDLLRKPLSTPFDRWRKRVF